jgi:hypothetical protein
MAAATRWWSPVGLIAGPRPLVVARPTRSLVESPATILHSLARPAV